MTVVILLVNFVISYCVQMDPRVPSGCSGGGGGGIHAPDLACTNMVIKRMAAEHVGLYFMFLAPPPPPKFLDPHLLTA